MRRVECAHVATVTPVDRLDSGVAKYSTTAGETTLAYEGSSSQVPCRFESRSEFGYRERLLEESVRGRLTCVAGRSGRSIQDKYGVEIVVLDGSKVTIRGDAYLVSGAEDVEDGKGRVIARRFNLVGPTHG